MHTNFTIPTATGGKLTIELRTDLYAHSYFSEHPQAWQFLVNATKDAVTRLTEQTLTAKQNDAAWVKFHEDLRINAEAIGPWISTSQWTGTDIGEEQR